MLSVRTFTEAGGHAVNEDSFSGRPHPDDERSLMVALADGMGGQAGGGRASELAVRAALENAGEMPLESVMACGWIDVMRRADAAVSADKQAGFTTLVGLSVQGDELRGAACGDSAVFVIDGPGRMQELTMGQVKNPPVGSGEAVFIPFASQFGSALDGAGDVRWRLEVCRLGANPASVEDVARPGVDRRRPAGGTHEGFRGIPGRFHIDRDTGQRMTDGSYT